jgi:hypothetical protein
MGATSLPAESLCLAFGEWGAGRPAVLVSGALVCWGENPALPSDGRQLPVRESMQKATDVSSYSKSRIKPRNNVLEMVPWVEK